MLSDSNSGGKTWIFFSAKPEPDAINGSTVNEDVVIYDECGDTLWDKVLLQEDKVSSPETGDDDKAE